MIVPSELAPLDSGIASQVIALAVTIAPCLHSLEGDEKGTAVSVLVSVGQSLPARRQTVGEKTRIDGQFSVTYYAPAEIGSAFTSDDRRILRSLCGLPVGMAPVGPAGSFPRPPRSLRELWPEEC